MLPAATWRALLLGLAGVGLSIPLLWRADNYQLYVLALVALTATVGVGLNVLIGLAGQFSLGHVAFYGIGAYSVGILTTKAGLSFWLALPFAGLLAALAGLLLAIPAIAVRGPYLAMVTIAFGFIFEQSAAEWGSLTGGWNGISGIPLPRLAGRIFTEREMAVLAFSMAVFAIWLFARLSANAWGRAMRSVRDAEIASQSIGLDPTGIRTVAFVVSAAAAGLAGGVFAAMSDFISPESFPLFQSILFVLVAMIGGTGSLWGPLIGALVVVLLPEVLSFLAGYRLLFFGCLLLVILRLAPDGVMGLLARLRGGGAPDVRARTGIDVAGYLADTNDRPALSVQKVSIRFGGVQAAADVSFAAPAGRITSLIGPNGAGKSTVLNLICGFYRPDQGRIKLGERDVTGFKPHQFARAGIARTFQTTQLFTEMSVLDNVRAGLQRGELALASLFGAAEEDRDIETAEGLLDFVGYRGSIHAKAGALSHVDRRIVEIARALSLRPGVLALDEPAAGLDAADKATLGALLERIATCGIAVVLVEHDMKLVMAVSHHVVVLDAGRRIAAGTPAAIARDPAVLAAYLGSAGAKLRTRTNPLPASSRQILVAADVSAGYGAVSVLRDVSLTLAEGEMVAVLGANGAGKTTLMRALSGLLRPIDGTVRMLGQNIETLAADKIVHAGLLLVPEGRQVFPELDVVDNLRLGSFAKPDTDQAPRIDAMLQRFPKLGERRKQRAGLLSGGEQQMLAIARGLMGKPVVLMLDEPSLGLAPALVEALYDLLAELRDEGLTILLVDQMAAMALSVADRAYVLQSGAIVQSGDADALRSDPAITAAYLESQ